MLIDKLKNITLENIGKQNIPAPRYFFRTSNESNKEDNVFNINDLCGKLIGLQDGKELKKIFSHDDFIDKCLEKFQEKIDDNKHIDIIKEIYFSNNKLPLLAPIIYMANSKSSKKTEKTFLIFKQMLQEIETNKEKSSQLNFIEQDIFDLFKEYTIDKKHNLQSHSYLRFLDKIFTEDFNYLLQNQHYFHTQVDRFLKFYMFTYSSQLALNIHDNPLVEPSSQEVYFALNHEKISSERKKLKTHGYKILLGKVKNLFPYLSLLETISKSTGLEDLKYYHFNEIDNNESNIDILDDLHHKFREARSMSKVLGLKSNSIVESIKSLLASTVQKIQIDNPAVFIRFISTFEEDISKPFFRFKGRAGNVLVLDQDTILLLTNISIANKPHLRFQDLIGEFNHRGVYFDAKSQDVLLELFERVGNIDRKSDSGDAVYVKSTI